MSGPGAAGSGSTTASHLHERLSSRASEEVMFDGGLPPGVQLFGEVPEYQ